ncbi:MAG: efflux RND transporter permease subunit [Lentisphaeria bacterium]|nr:efflux RND transporter permease subunit [Lentisphaeria bacterium]
MIRWFVKNHVASNLLMVTFIFLGYLSLQSKIILEFFPDFDSDIITVQVPYRGATPEEVEEAIVIKVEEEVQDLEGIEELRSTSSEGSGRVSIEVEDGYDPRELLDDVKNRVDGISTFPEESEKPIYNIALRKKQVISVILAGDMPEHVIRELGEHVRDELLEIKSVSQVDLTEVRPFEIAIEIDKDQLRRYDLTLTQVSQAIQRTSLDVPAGNLKTSGGEILLRTLGQAYTKSEYEKIVVKRTLSGGIVYLRDIAIIRDDFEEEPIEARFNGERCVLLEVYRVGNESAIEISKKVRDYIDARQDTLPPGVKLDYWRDFAKIIQKRLDTLFNSALQGGILVLILLTLFLRPAIAIWVCIGIPISFIGSLYILPYIGVTINMISVFGYILVLGIVVDDAIVTAENIYTHVKEGDSGEEAAIRGTEEVSVPVTFGVLTTAVAFIPLAMIEGNRGTLFAQLTFVVVPVLLLSLVESKLILPSHLKHLKAVSKKDMGTIGKLQRSIADTLELFVEKVYQPALGICIRNRYITLASFTAVFILTVSLVAFGHIRFVFFPKIQSETATANIRMPNGTNYDITKQYVERITKEAFKLKEKYRDPDTGESVIRHILSTSGSQGSTSGQSNLGRVRFEITSPEDRSLKVTSIELVNEWRKNIGELAGVEELTFRAEIGRSSDPIELQLRGNDVDDLREASVQVKDFLGNYAGVFDINDDFESGKTELKIRLKPQAEILNVQLADVARHIRNSFFGNEAQRIQRGRNDIRVMVRFPKEARSSIDDIETLYIKTPEGFEVPISEVAEISQGQGFSSIKRINRKRIITIKADAIKETVNLPALNTELQEFCDTLVKQYPGMRYSLEGEAKEQSESANSLVIGLAFVFFCIYALLAIPFGSYSQPFIVMSIIPFGFIGAVVGHILMGMNMSLFSFMGLLALIGVLVNDSLVLVDYINQQVAKGKNLFDAVSHAGQRRFRPIFLTSVTTFFGLVPLIFEKSTQAQFLIPMAITLGFGVLISTLVTLILVPINYLILEDIGVFLKSLKSKLWDLEKEQS